MSSDYDAILIGADTIQPFPAFTEIFYFALEELMSTLPTGVS